jgi:hypothetical protein
MQDGYRFFTYNMCALINKNLMSPAGVQTFTKNNQGNCLAIFDLSHIIA